MKVTSQEKGFSIIESLIAISILLMAVVGATSAIQTGLSSYISSKNQIIAFYLAQEGFEQLRNIRDENGLNYRDWLTGIADVPSDPCSFGRACTVSPAETSAMIACSSPGNCPLLRQNASTGFFGYNSSWPETVFRREISLEQINSEEISVTVTVSWRKGMATREFKAKENLLSWQQ